MSRSDARDCSISGATPAALAAYEQGLATFQCWRNGTEAQLAIALQEAPSFVMAYALQAYLRLCSRDAQLVRSARPLLTSALNLPINERERLHLAAIAAVLADDYELAKTRLGELLREQPHDVLALQVAHALDYVTGDMARMNDRVAAVLPAWSNELPGYHAVLAMHAFGLEECGEYRRAEETAHAALALNAFDARAHHVMAHVFEMTERAAAGVRWMNQHVVNWSEATLVATHCWWHLSLFHLAQDQVDDALMLYDQKIRASDSGELADLIDAAALLWRIQLHGHETHHRWVELASLWAERIDDQFCSFSDVHAMMAFVGAQDWHRARRLEHALIRSQRLPTRYGATTRRLGLPACQALLAFGLGENAKATSLFASMPMIAHRLGGSHAQRDVLHLTLLRAIERIRRPAHQHSIAANVRRRFYQPAAMS